MSDTKRIKTIVVNGEEYDLGGYLPITGGDMQGSLNIETEGGSILRIKAATDDESKRRWLILSSQVAEEHMIASIADVYVNEDTGENHFDYVWYRELDGASAWTPSAGGEKFPCPEICRGYVDITPSAKNTPTAKSVTWKYPFKGTPTVVCSPYSSAPDEISCSFSNRSSTEGEITVVRTSTTSARIMYIAVYYGSI